MSPTDRTKLEELRDAYALLHERLKAYDETHRLSQELQDELERERVARMVAETDVESYRHQLDEMQVAHAALRHKLARVEALPDKWYERGHNWRDQYESSTDIAAGRELQDDACAAELEAALRGEGE